MQRFFLQTSHLGDNQIILDDEEIVYQLVKVLRASIGDEVIFFDGVRFIDYKYRITSIDKKNIILVLVGEIEKNKELINLNLFQSLPNKIDKIEEIIQKGVEVGYNDFIFFRAERSQDLKLSDNKIERFNKIIKEAVEQSGRNIIPKLSFLTKFDINMVSGQKNLFFHTDSINSIKLKNLTIPNESINVFIGPEGGFSEKEVKNFADNGFTKINLGSNILRTQTAAISVGFYIIQNNF